jgi:hypothetical protein
MVLTDKVAALGDRTPHDLGGNIMRHALGLFGGALVGLCAVAALEGSARAQEAYLRTAVPAPANAFELQLSAGYTQGFGNIVPNHSIGDVAGAGLGFTVAIAYRYTPHLSFDLEGQYQAFTSSNFGTSEGLDTNVGVTLHGAPHRRGDPWLRLATGYRWVWLSSVLPVAFANEPIGANVTFSGFDLINARIGYDVRSSGAVAWAPLVGATLQTFVWANGGALSSVQWGTYIYAGLQARFDAGGSRSNVATARSGFAAE